MELISFYPLLLDPASVRVLLCGDAADLRQCVNAVSEAVNDDPFILSRIIVAIEDVSLPIHFAFINTHHLCPC